MRIVQQKWGLLALAFVGVLIACGNPGTGGNPSDDGAVQGDGGTKPVMDMSDDGTCKPACVGDMHCEKGACVPNPTCYVDPENLPPGICGEKTLRGLDHIVRRTWGCDDKTVNEKITVYDSIPDVLEIMIYTDSHSGDYRAGNGMLWDCPLSKDCYRIRFEDYDDPENFFLERVDRGTPMSASGVELITTCHRNSF